MGLAEGCRRVEPAFIEDDEAEMEFVFAVLLDRWGDRRVPQHTPHPMDCHRMPVR